MYLLRRFASYRAVGLALVILLTLPHACGY
jgi:hypothetical protein